MNNKTLLLTKILIKNGEGLGFKLNSKKAWLLFFLVLGISVPSLLYGYVQLIGLLYHSLAGINQQGVLLSWVLAINSMFIFVAGILYITSSFYFAGDIEHYLPLPLKPRQIVGAKILLTIIYDYLISLLIFAPPLIYYGVHEGAGFLYYLYGAVVFILIPVMPVAFAAVLVMLIMRFTNLSRFKELFKIVGGILAMFLGLGINFGLQFFAGKVDETGLIGLLEKGDNSLTVLTSRIFPTVQWGVQALVNSAGTQGFTNLVTFVGLSVAVYTALLFFSELVYLKGAVGISETRAGAAVTDQDLAKLIKKDSVLKASTLAEFRILVRTPVYFLNCVLINFIWPIFIIIPLVFSPSEATSDLAGFQTMLADPGSLGIVLGGILAIITFVGGSNGIAATAISREGQNLYIRKYIPVSYRQQITAKILPSIIFGFISLLMLVVMLVTFYKLPIYLGLAALVIGILPTIFTSFTGILLDLHNPKLEWDSEQKAVKNNMNVIYSVLVSAVVGGVIGILTAVLRSHALLGLGVIIALVGGLDLGLYRLVYTKGVAEFARLEG